MGDREATLVVTAVPFYPTEAQATTAYELVPANSSFNMAQSLQPQLQRFASDPDTATVRTRGRAFSDLEFTPILLRYIPQQFISSFRIFREASRGMIIKTRPGVFTTLDP